MTSTPAKQNLLVLASDIVDLAKKEGASACEIDLGQTQGFSVATRLGDIESIEYDSDIEMNLTVYKGHKKGSASTSDFSMKSVSAAVKKACAIAEMIEEDPCAGLADASLMPKDVLDLDLYHPWGITPEEAKNNAIACERLAMEQSKKITNSEGCTVATNQGHGVYANSHGFIGEVKSTSHEISCMLIAEEMGEKERDYSYTTACAHEDLETWRWVAENAATRTVARLGAKKMKTCKTPVVFSPELARSLLGNFVSAISGGSLYRESSFLLNHLGKEVFPSWVNIFERPHILKGIGSIAFDADGVATYDKNFVTDGALSSYSLSDYSAKRLKMKTTANSGGVHNLRVTNTGQSFEELLQTMGTGLYVTELIGQGVNLVTGDYSRGAFGYWVENGEIQYPVHEITIANNLKTMLKTILAIGNDTDKRGNIQTGSILIEEMMIAGS